MNICQNEDHTIIHGDAIEALSGCIPDNSVNLIFADPPYNIGKNFNGRKDKWPNEKEYLNWCYKWIDLCINKLKSDGSFYLMASTQSMPYFDMYLRKKMEILSRIVWAYDSSGVQAKKYFGSLYEPILFCVKDKKNYTFNAQDILVEAKTGAKRNLIDYRGEKPKPYNTKKVPGNVWNFPRVRYRMEEYEKHPTQKPVAVIERIIIASSNPGDIVLDPFSGTFTTSYVAKKYNRKSIGVEAEEEYVKIGLRRMQIQSHYKGEKLQRELKTYERKNYPSEHQLLIFSKKENYGTSVHQ
ncbi:SAM-dependent DNA methylase [Desulfonema limicola]|uniref:Methyltransferase n=1 Tax=Desulfonema limicola TaxID=45656 RepID=A0A975GJ39_9BACT|nr:adenine-specific DNA-methyltransferase [Desulfonema limicola]QTA83156.1 SAM-dependent DNA methylase [Desulfonema limicola]